MIIYIPFLVCILGLVVYALTANAKVAELARIAYFCGLLVTLFEVAGHMVSALGK